MEIGITTSMENQGGTLKLRVVEAGCSMDDISITLEGGASWLYQGYEQFYDHTFDTFLGAYNSSNKIPFLRIILHSVQAARCF